MDPLEAFFKNNPLSYLNHKKQLQETLVERLDSDIPLEPRETPLENRQNVKIYVGRLSLQGSQKPMAYMVLEKSDDKRVLGIFKQPNCPYEIFDPDTHSSKQIVDPLEFYSTCDDLIKTLNGQLSVIEFIPQDKGKEEEEAEAIVIPVATPVEKKKTKTAKRKIEETEVEVEAEPEPKKKKKTTTSRRKKSKTAN